MRGVFLTVFPHIGHMAVHAGHTGIGMDAGRPDFKIRMLSLQHRRLGVGMNPILLESTELLTLGLIELELFFRFPAANKGMTHPAIFGHKVILVMALAADIAPHFIMGSLADINALQGHGFNKALLINAQFHGIRVMTGRTAHVQVCTFHSILIGIRRRCLGKRQAGKIPAAFLIPLVVHPGTLADNAVALLRRDALRIQLVHTGPGMPAGHIILHREFIAFEILLDFRLHFDIGFSRVAAAVTGGAFPALIVFHIGIVFQRISLFIGFFAHMGIIFMGYLGQLDAVIIGRCTQTHHHEAEEQRTDGHNPC